MKSVTYIRKDEADMMWKDFRRVFVLSADWFTNIHHMTLFS